MSVSYHVYGNAGGGGPVDYTTVLATTSATTWSSAPLADSSSWRFAVRAFDTVTSLEERNVDAAVSVIVSAAGTDATNVPPPPHCVTATPAAGGMVRVNWTYPAAIVARTPATPTAFHVYAGTTGSPSYTTPVATVAATGTTQYGATIGPYADGTTVTVGVRAANTSGEEANTATTSAIAAATGPAACVSLTAITTTVG